MPDKYEREIEEILRKIDRREPATRTEREWPGPRPRRNVSLPPLGFSELCLLIAIVTGLAAGGWAYALGGGNLITGVLAIVGAICLVLVACSSFLTNQRRSPSNRWH
jgi:hypothetical protein